MSILHLPELRFASQLLLEPPVIPTTKQNNTDKKVNSSRAGSSYNVISSKMQNFYCDCILGFPVVSRVGFFDIFRRTSALTAPFLMTTCEEYRVRRGFR